MSQSNETKNDVFKIFADAVRAVVKHMCVNQKLYVIPNLKIDFVSKTWKIDPVVRQDYSINYEEIKELNEIKRYLEFMLKGEGFQKNLGKES